MYVDHFKLSEKPFSNCPGDGLFTPNEEFESAVARLEQVLMSRDAVAVVTGGPGVGKTTLVSAAAKRIGDKAIVAYVDMRLADPNLLFDLLLLNLGGESGASDLAASLYQLKSTIARHNEEQGRKVTAVIDVSSLTIERAKRILQLVHMAGEPGGQLNVILLGPHVLHKLMDTPGLIHMRQRVTFRFRARPLTAVETEAYIKHQLEQCNGQADSIMPHDASKMVFRYVGGVPRLINTLVDATLGYAAEKGAESISEQMVSEVAHLLGWRRLAGKAPSKAKKGQRAAEKPTAGSTAATASKSTASKSEEPSPLEAAAAQSQEPARAADSQAKSEPISDGTAMLMATALDLDEKPGTDNTPDLKLEEAAKKPDAESPSADDRDESKQSAMPEMDASDTSATGMLRLEDLDARFAETVFGDDASLFKLDGDGETDPKKAAV